MLRQLSKALGAKPTEVVMRLIRDAYARKLPGLQSSAGFGFLELLPQPRRAATGARGKATPEKKSAVKNKAPARRKKA